MRIYSILSLLKNLDLVTQLICANLIVTILCYSVASYIMLVITTGHSKYVLQGCLDAIFSIARKIVKNKHFLFKFVLNKKKCWISLALQAIQKLGLLLFHVTVPLSSRFLLQFIHGSDQVGSTSFTSICSMIESTLRKNCTLFTYMFWFLPETNKIFPGNCLEFSEQLILYNFCSLLFL